MPRLAVGLEYDGTAFCGWQSQQSLESVQSLVEAALGRVADVPVQLTAAGRTDAGVHARAQVAHFDTDAVRAAQAWIMGGNKYLPRSIALRWAAGVPDHFHARYSAQSRTYRYCILNRAHRPALAAQRVALVRPTLDAARMQAAGQLLIGLHDFSAFRAAQCQSRTPVRNLMALRVARCGEFVVIEVTANAFLHHMVRNIAGLLIAVGEGALAPPRAAELLVLRDRRLAPATAPPEGLYFWKVGYPAPFGLPDDSAMMPSLTGCPADLMDLQPAAG
jgi:tRNA pseudouridine38-40 synthase